eukprot:TRINITY_DN36292_c1_g1_i1.p1 TRINITY_DN36292_c1_g1~~TRINITY_DN36292_c1_g1_i1.p1  ORF type:complete len:279 (-),score=15.79 TRINITY_DN36292_c1_g1_i1:539-1375(-)
MMFLMCGVQCCREIVKQNKKKKKKKKKKKSLGALLFSLHIKIKMMRVFVLVVVLNFAIGLPCFSGSSKVLTENGELKTMSTLVLGDKVQVVDSQTGITTFDEVYNFMDKKQDVILDVVHLQTNNATLNISPYHYIYRTHSLNCASLKCAQVVPASWLKPGDVIFVVMEGNMKKEVVTSSQVMSAVGAFSPLTSSGTIVVEGIVASVYSDRLLQKVLPTFLHTKVPSIYHNIMSWVQGFYQVGTSFVAGFDVFSYENSQAGWLVSFYTHIGDFLTLKEL